MEHYTTLLITNKPAHTLIYFLPIFHSDNFFKGKKYFISHNYLLLSFILLCFFFGNKDIWSGKISNCSQRFCGQRV